MSTAQQKVILTLHLLKMFLKIKSKKQKEKKKRKEKQISKTQRKQNKKKQNKFIEYIPINLHMCCADEYNK